MIILAPGFYLINSSSTLGATMGVEKVAYMDMIPLTEAVMISYSLRGKMLLLENIEWITIY